jgi:hypothetical protein
MPYKGANGVKAKFIGTPIVGPKKKAIWVPKTYTNCGPKEEGHLGTKDLGN